jgi:hypothetical protein
MESSGQFRCVSKDGAVIVIWAIRMMSSGHAPLSIESLVKLIGIFSAVKNSRSESLQAARALAIQELKHSYFSIGGTPNIRGIVGTHAFPNDSICCRALVSILPISPTIGFFILYLTPFALKLRSLAAGYPIFSKFAEYVVHTLCAEMSTQPCRFRFENSGVLVQVDD